jgi:hypothetical protein
MEGLNNAISPSTGMPSTSTEGSVPEVWTDAHYKAVMRGLNQQRQQRVYQEKA